MGKIQGAFLNHQGAAPDGSQNANTIEESDSHGEIFPASGGQ